MSISNLSAWFSFNSFCFSWCEFINTCCKWSYFIFNNFYLIIKLLTIVFWLLFIDSIEEEALDSLRISIIEEDLLMFGIDCNMSFNMYFCVSSCFKSVSSCPFTDDDSGQGINSNLPFFRHSSCSWGCTKSSFSIENLPILLLFDTLLWWFLELSLVNGSDFGCSILDDISNLDLRPILYLVYRHISYSFTFTTFCACHTRHRHSTVIDLLIDTKSTFFDLTTFYT